MDDIIERRDGLVIMLPKYESVGAVKRLGRFMIFANAALDRFGIGFQILEAGIILQIGPFYFGICHIARQEKAFDRLDAHLASLPSSKGIDNDHPSK